MTDALVALPSTTLGRGDLAALAECASLVAEGRVVVVGTQRGEGGEVLDEFVIAAALAAIAPQVRVGVRARAGQGRAASIVAREATTAELLGACHAVLLDGEPGDCADAATILEALFEPGRHTVRAGDEHVVDAPNLPAPASHGGPPVRWAHGAELRALGPAGAHTVGEVLVVTAGEALPAAAPESLVVLHAPLARPGALAATLRR